MTPRENILKLLRREGFEEIPVEFSLCPSLVDEYKKKTGADVDYSEYFHFPWQIITGPRRPKHEPVDWTQYYDHEFKEGTTFDGWGVAQEPGSDAAYHMTRMYHPMKNFDSLEQMQAYPCPDYDNATIDHMPGQVEAIHKRGYAAMAWLACTIWETAWYMRSMEQLMSDMMSNDEMAVYLLDRVTGISCICAAAFARAGVDHLHLGDDVGMQQSLMMSEEMYREWLKPRLIRVIKAARDQKPDILISYHSCGYVTPLIGDLIEAGIDVLNPVQPECMDFAEIHAEFGDRLSFWGTIGTQSTMPFKTPEEVRQVVRHNLEIAGQKGGLFCSPTHMLEPEVPWENIEAYVSACREFTHARK